MRQTDIFSRNFLLIAIGFLYFVITAVVILTVDKGFDFTDEGYFLLDFKYPEVYRGGIHNYHLVITKLTSWMNPSILAYRWMSYALTTICSFVLSFGLYKWLKSVYSEDWMSSSYVFIFFFISIGNFMFYFPGFHIIHNNTLTNFVLQSVTGLFLYLLSLKSDIFIKSKRSFITLCFLGFLCGFSFFIKFTTAVTMFLLVSSTITLYYWSVKRTRLLMFLLIQIFGVLIGIFFYFVFIQSYSEWIVNFKDAYFMLSDHSPGKLLREYILSVYSFLRFIFIFFSWLVLLPLVLFFEKTLVIKLGTNATKILFFVLAIVAALLLSYLIIYFNIHRSAFFTNKQINAYFFLLCILVQLVFLVVLSIRGGKSMSGLFVFFRTKGPVLFFLLIIPFLGSFGTANPLFLNVLIHLAPLFALALVLTVELCQQADGFFYRFFFIALIALISTLQIVDGCIYNPYYSSFMNASRPSYFQQNNDVSELPLLGGIKVDNSTKVFLLELKTLLKRNNFIKQYPILGFHIPGVVYLMEGISPGMPYYFNMETRDCAALQRFGNDGRLPIIMLTDNDVINEEFLSCLAEKKIVYPDDYVKVGEVFYPNSGSMLNVYFPKSFNANEK